MSPGLGLICLVREGAGGEGHHLIKCKVEIFQFVRLPCLHWGVLHEDIFSPATAIISILNVKNKQNYIRRRRKHDKKNCCLEKRTENGSFCSKLKRQELG